MSTIRVLIPGDDQSEEIIALAFSYADEICKLSQGKVQEAILFVPVKDSIKCTTLTSALGESDAKKLHDGELVALPSGVPIRLETIRTLRWVNKPSVLISIYSDQKMLDQVDSTNNLFAIVAVPHAPEALERWRKTWSATVHGIQKASAQPLISDPIVEQALVSLTNGINLSHSLLNPRDKEHTEKTLRILRANGHIEKPENLRSWSIKNGWQPKAADEFEKLATRILSLKSKPRLPDPEVAKRIYDYWCSKV